MLYWLNGYTNYFKTYNIFQDYVSNLLVMLDLFLPIKMVMEAFQGYAVVAWKCVIYIQSLQSHFKKMSFGERISTPMLSEHYDYLTNS